MKELSRFRANGKAKSIYLNDTKASFDAQVRLSVGVSGVERVLRISGPDVWAQVVLSNSEAARIGALLAKPMNMKNSKTGEQVVYFPRKAKAKVEV